MITRNKIILLYRLYVINRFFLFVQLLHLTRRWSNGNLTEQTDIMFVFLWPLLTEQLGIKATFSASKSISLYSHCISYSRKQSTKSLFILLSQRKLFPFVFFFGGADDPEREHVSAILNIISKLQACAVQSNLSRCTGILRVYGKKLVPVYRDPGCFCSYKSE